jgi:hypothetical protein
MLGMVSWCEQRRLVEGDAEAGVSESFIALALTRQHVAGLRSFETTPGVYRSETKARGSRQTSKEP